MIGESEVLLGFLWLTYGEQALRHFIEYVSIALPIILVGLQQRPLEKKWNILLFDIIILYDII